VGTARVRVVPVHVDVAVKLQVHVDDQDQVNESIQGALPTSAAFAPLRARHQIVLVVVDLDLDLDRDGDGDVSWRLSR
jgi:hypothetical protein